MKKVKWLLGLGLIVGLTSCGNAPEEETVEDEMDDLMEELFEEEEVVEEGSEMQEALVGGIWEYTSTNSEGEVDDLGDDDLEFFGDGSFLSMPKGSGGADWHAGYYEIDGDYLILDEETEYEIIEVSETTLKLQVGIESVNEYTWVVDELMSEEDY